MLARESKDLAPVLRQQRLVGRYNMLPGLERRDDKAQRCAGSADKLDDDLYFRIVENRAIVAGKTLLRQAERAQPLPVKVNNPPHLDVPAAAGTHNGVVLAQRLHHAGAHSTETHDTNLDAAALHVSSSSTDKSCHITSQTTPSWRPSEFRPDSSRPQASRYARASR